MEQIVARASSFATKLGIFDECGMLLASPSSAIETRWRAVSQARAFREDQHSSPDVKVFKFVQGQTASSGAAMKA